MGIIEVGTETLPSLSDTSATETTSSETSSPETSGTEAEDEPSPIYEKGDITLLFSRVADMVRFDVHSTEAWYFRHGRTGGFAFTASTYEEFLAYRDLFSELATDSDYKDSSDEELYGSVDETLFEDNVIVFLADNAYTAHETDWRVREVGNQVIVELKPTDRVGDVLFEWEIYFPGVSCWVVPKDLLAQREVYFRTAGMSLFFIDHITFYTPDEYRVIVEGICKNPEIPFGYSAYDMTERHYCRVQPFDLEVDDAELQELTSVKLKYSENSEFLSCRGTVSTLYEYNALLNVVAGFCDIPEILHSLNDEFFEENQLIYSFDIDPADGSTLCLNVHYVPVP
ncbi:MAG: hypothetical protein IKZ19_05835 [Clostridia bacterium]|nr:hypothetical protein [Clostridia bacterium]